MISGPLDILQDVIRRFQKENIEYFLVGSLAAMYYGRPRFTRDIDLVVQINPEQVVAFEKLFPLKEYYCPPIEILRDEIVHRGSFNLIHQASGIKIDIVVHKQTEFYQSEFKRRKRVELLPHLEVYIASPEDIVLKKLDFYREGASQKHLTDIRELLVETKLDQQYLKKWLKELGLERQWEQI